ncbi:hypothetical protein NECAME_17963 [Necator americanus]|uniref:Uncharacterized protein n=1 Tax=Necator americanus TaxID=51031 RepID=W2TGG4_NECAM|nr:hypothetical protein NECAME_17963 [Necator americanus]ETN80923.1 hypothetical protein NECAME_17963 [Necator americanus]
MDSRKSERKVGRLILLWQAPLSLCRRCDSSDYDFEYTECSADGSRWRVAIPHQIGACEGLPEPTRGLNCCRF